MIYDCTESVERDLEYQLDCLRKYKKRLRQLDYLDGIGLVASFRNGHPRYYKVWRSNGKEHRKYLGKKQQSERIRLQERYYLRHLIKRCERNISLMKKFLKEYSSLDFDVLLEELPCAYKDKEVLCSTVIGRRTASSWEKLWADYMAESDPYRSDGLRNTALDGTSTRSKGEALECAILNALNIPYVFEPTLWIDGIPMHPDILMYDEKRDREIIIEHLGLLDKPGYVQTLVRKLNLYIAAGYELNKTLVLTSDNRDGSTDSAAITEIIKTVMNIK